MVAALGLPINDLFRYALLLFATVMIAFGAVVRRPALWLGAVAIVALAVAAQMKWPAPRIDEGHNVFVIERPGGVLERSLPAEAYRLMAAEFDARYPAGHRCAPAQSGCWYGTGPERAYAFSADGIYDGARYSRRVTGIDFSDPVWLRLGAINETQYNWLGDSDLQRGKRAGRGDLLHPWQLTMPFFVMYRFPADFVGSRLCWRGDMLWPGADGHFTAVRHAKQACRPVGRDDVGRPIFGLSVAAPLAMELETPLALQLHRLMEPALTFIAVVAVLLLLVRWRARQLALPLTLVGLALLVVLLHDASFIGGIRPFDGGDDGLVYEGVGRRILQYALAGDFHHALEGGESVYYYGGPGLRYFRAIEHAIFGDSFLGYLSLMLVMPFPVFALFRRFLTRSVALALTLVFVAIPVGALFGSTYFQYVKWAARGFADPAAAVFFIGGLVWLIGRTAGGPERRFAPAMAAGLLFALALWVRPNLAPGAAVLLGGAGLAALWHGQFRRLAGLCLGFLPVFGMALHNWYFGGVFVLFSSNATVAQALPMPPSAYVAALQELLHGNMAGEHVRGFALQWARWLAGPSESFAMIPFHVAAIVILLRVAVWGRHCDPWLRLIAAAALALHPVAWFYLSSGRYYMLTWFLTLLVCVVWMRDEGFAMLRRRMPRFVAALEAPSRGSLARALDRLAGPA
jgi:hypothetical protein